MIKKNKANRTAISIYCTKDDRAFYEWAAERLRFYSVSALIRWAATAGIEARTGKKAVADFWQKVAAVKAVKELREQGVFGTGGGDGAFQTVAVAHALAHPRETREAQKQVVEALRKANPETEPDEGLGAVPPPDQSPPQSVPLVDLNALGPSGELRPRPLS